MRSTLGFRFGWLIAALLATAPLAFAPAGPVFAQDMRSLSERIERLQRDVDVLQRQLARGGTPAPSGAASAPLSGGAPPSSDYINRSEDRFSALESELRTLTGKIEELSHQIAQTQQRLDKLVTDVDFRLTTLEKGAGAGAAATSTEATPPAPTLGAAQVAPGQQRLVLQPGPGAPAGAQASAPVQLPQGSPEAQYEFAMGLLRQAQREQAELSGAEQAWRAFIAAHPNHRLTGAAQYWLGETFYARRDYQNAMAVFAEGVQKYPRSDKAPDLMLKLGMSLGQLNRKSEACGTLGEIDKRHPQAATSIKQTAQRERQRLACG